MPKDYGDKPIEEIMAMMKQWRDTHPGAQCYLKWTCPGCGDRVTATEPNIYCVQGYRHDECGTVYHGHLFGLLVAYRATLPEREEDTG